MSAPLVLNAVYPMTGFFTKALFLRSQPASELENRLGYAAGRLASGWWLLFLEQMPAPADFEFMGYSQMSGGIPRGHLNPPGGLTAEQSLHRSGHDLLKLKQNVVRGTFHLAGPERLAKVLPLASASGPVPYPPGSGIPQWRLVHPLPFRAAAMISAGQVYLGNYT